MRLVLQKKLAAKIKNVSPKRIKLESESAQEIKEALTKADVRGLISKGLIKVKQKQNTSKARARRLKLQKKKGRRKGPGSRKGTRTARKPRKRVWIDKIRAQREFLRMLKEKELVSTKDNRDLYLKAKSGFFRSRRHIKTYITERGIVKQNGKK